MASRRKRSFTPAFKADAVKLCRVGDQSVAVQQQRVREGASWKRVASKLEAQGRFVLSAQHV